MWYTVCTSGRLLYASKVGAGNLLGLEQRSEMADRSIVAVRISVKANNVE